MENNIDYPFVYSSITFLIGLAIFAFKISKSPEKRKPNKIL